MRAPTTSPPERIVARGAVPGRWPVRTKKKKAADIIAAFFSLVLRLGGLQLTG
jgi:hypothetical protein